MVLVTGPVLRAALLVMLIVRLQVRDPVHVPRPIVCTRRTQHHETRATGRAPVALHLRVRPATPRSAPTDRSEIDAQFSISATAGAAAVTSLAGALGRRQSDGESSRACGSACSAVATRVPAGNCSTVAR